MKKSFFTFIIAIFVANVLSAQSNLLWKYKTNDRIYSTPAITSKYIFFGSGDSTFYALDKTSGNIIWAFKTNGTIHSDATVSAESVFFGSSDSYLYSVNISDGKLNWKFKTETEKKLDLWDYYISSPIVHGENVFYGGGDGYLYAINIFSGKQTWRFHCGNIVHAKPVIADDKLFVGDFGGYFYAIDIKTGQQIWQFRTVGDTYFPKGEIQKAATYDNGILYFGSRDFNIYAVDAKTGRAHWNMKEVGSWVISTPYIYNNYAYFGTSDTHRFYCADKKNGVVKWKIDLPMRVYGSALAHNEVVYFGCFDGIVRGVDYQTGKLKWQFKTPASEKNKSKVYAADGRFRDDFKLYGDNIVETENMILNLGAILSTPVIENNILYFGSSDGYMYAVIID